MSVSELTPELATKYGYSDDAKGVIVTSVEPGSVAQEKGMIPGALITKVERKAVASTASAKELLAKADPNRGVLVQFEYPPRLGGGGASKVLKPAMANK
jgi:serine protease Do